MAATQGAELTSEVEMEITRLGRELDELIAALSNATRADVLEALEARPGARAGEVAELTGRPERSVYRALAYLRGAGMVEREAGGRGYRLRRGGRSPGA